MNPFYFIIPQSDIWNSDAIVSQMRTQYDTQSEAIERAKELSRQYNTNFFVCCIQAQITTISQVDMI